MEESKDKIYSLVRGRYAAIAKGDADGCAPPCCDESRPLATLKDLGKVLEYTERDLALAPGEANLGLGCGNPVSRAALKAGEVVLDLGSGAGFDAFLAARQVGPSGKVIGVDMTPEMVDRAARNAEKFQVANVIFRLGQIERLPLTDASVDVAISNCVINLSPDKSVVFGEIHRVLKPGGRMVISDVLRSGEIPQALQNDPTAYTG
ncbi:MAG: arsenite methyltransferase [Desulfobacteraceae bacterium]|jgi:SAM-dependent methyltransferase